MTAKTEELRLQSLVKITPFSEIANNFFIHFMTITLTPQQHNIFSSLTWIPDSSRDPNMPFRSTQSTQFMLNNVDNRIYSWINQQ